jgi:tRNA-specific 2-thiouridylase
VDFGDERLLRCAAAGRAPLRVAVLVSGGVDSSVALRLLHAAGHRCTAFYLKIWFQVHTRCSLCSLLPPLI